MIYETKGDAVQMLQMGLIDGLMHCCNAQGVMGAGIAAQIKSTFPKAFEIYRDQYFKSKHDTSQLMGRVSYADGVYNIVAQMNTGGHQRQVHYGHLARGIIRSIERSNHVMSTGDRRFKMGMPKYMASALAGGDWEIVHELVVGLFANSSCDLYIIEFNK